MRHDPMEPQPIRVSSEVPREIPQAAIEPTWLDTSDEGIDNIVDSENVILLQALVYKLKAERDVIQHRRDEP